jgi:phosphorylcholine metabolism protein LicD
MKNISEINRKRFLDHVVPIKNILESLGILFWLDFGTLLGAARNNKIMDWDHDFDLAVLDDDREKLILAKKKLEAKGFRVVFQKNLPWFEDLIQIYIPRNDLATDSKRRIMEGFDHIDIYVFTKIGDKACMREIHGPTKTKMISYLTYRFYRLINQLDPQNGFSTKKKIIAKAIKFIMNSIPKKSKHFISELVWQKYLNSAESAWLISPLESYKEFTKLALYGVDFNVPKEYEKHLEYWYSENWRIPDSNWNTNNNGGRFIKKLKNSEITHTNVQPVRNFDKYLWE